MMSVTATQLAQTNSNEEPGNFYSSGAMWKEVN